MGCNMLWTVNSELYFATISRVSVCRGFQYQDRIKRIRIQKKKKKYSPILLAVTIYLFGGLGNLIWRSFGSRKIGFWRPPDNYLNGDRHKNMAAARLYVFLTMHQSVSPLQIGINYSQAQHVIMGFNKRHKNIVRC